MSNKPQSDPQFHDACDPTCIRHAEAKRYAGVKPKPECNCPACNPVAE